MRRFVTAAAVLGFFGLFCGMAEARVTYPEGRACAGRWGSGPELIRVAGVFMASRYVRPHQGNPFDTRTYQGCFDTVERCQDWQARLASRFPVPPAVNICAPVRLR